MQPRSVVPEQPLHNCILRLPVVLELHSVQPLNLQRAEQRLRAGVVPAVAFSTHGSFYPMLGEQVRVAPACILAATIAMEDQAVARRPAVPGHVERAAGQLRRDRLAHRPAHDAPAQTVFAAATVKLRASRFGAMGRRWLLSVVTTRKRRLPRPRRPFCRIVRSTRRLPTRMPLAFSCRHTRAIRRPRAPRCRPRESRPAGPSRSDGGG